MPIFRRAIAIALLSALVLAAGLPAAEAGKAGEVRSRSFELLNEGVAAYKRGEYEDAVERLSLSASMALNSFRAYFYLSLALIGDRRYADALKALEVALDLDPGHVQSLVAQGDALLKLGDLAEAQASFYQALKLRPEFPPSLDGLARIEEAGGKDDEAIRTYLRAIAADRGFAPSYTHLGDLYLRLDRIEEAVRLLEEAVEVRPDYAPGLNRLALAFGRLGLNNEAIATIQKAIGLEPTNALHRAALGELQLNQGFILAAEKSFLHSLQLDDGLPEARHGLAEVARRRGMYDLALGQIDLALIDPRMDAPTAQRLEAYRERVERERVLLAALEQRIAADEATPRDYGDLARVYAGRGMWAEAIDLQRRAGDDPAQRERLGYMLFQGGRFRDAHEIYDALAASTGDGVAAANDGVTLALLGDDAAAVAAYRRALEADPDLARTRVYLANALLRLGQRDEAIESYRVFLDLGFKGEASERVRRIMLQIAPELLTPEPSPLQPPPPTREDDKKKKQKKGDSES